MCFKRFRAHINRFKQLFYLCTFFPQNIFSETCYQNKHFFKDFINFFLLYRLQKKLPWNISQVGVDVDENWTSDWSKLNEIVARESSNRINFLSTKLQNVLGKMYGYATTHIKNFVWRETNDFVKNRLAVKYSIWYTHNGHLSIIWLNSLIEIQSIIFWSHCMRGKHSS